MASKNNNLSNVDVSSFKFMLGKKIGIVVSEWNEKITNGLKDGAVKTLINAGISERNIIIHNVPGSFELPFGAKSIINSNLELDAVICIGCIIRGETSHFDFVGQGVTYGIQKLNMEQDIPVIFCVLTDNNLDQSIARSGGELGNKGDEAAVSALKMIQLKDKLN